MSILQKASEKQLISWPAKSNEPITKRFVFLFLKMELYCTMILESHSKGVRKEMLSEVVLGW